MNKEIALDSDFEEERNRDFVQFYIENSKYLSVLFDKIKTKYRMLHIERLQIPKECIYYRFYRLKHHLKQLRKRVIKRSKPIKKTIINKQSKHVVFNNKKTNKKVFTYCLFRCMI